MAVVKRTKYDDYEDISERIECNEPTEHGNEGFLCLHCQILFNVHCDGVVMHIISWGFVHTDEDSDNFDENYEYTCNEEEPPKYFLKDEDEALSDHSMYLWHCPCCKETFTTCSD